MKDTVKNISITLLVFACAYLLAVGTHHKKRHDNMKRLPLMFYRQGYMEGAINVLENKQKNYRIDFDDTRWQLDSTETTNNYYKHIR